MRIEVLLFFCIAGMLSIFIFGLPIAIIAAKVQGDLKKWHKAVFIICILGFVSTFLTLLAVMNDFK